MSFGNNSKIFRPHIANIWGSGTDDFLSHTIRSALYGDTPTPNQDVSLAASGYNAVGSQWVTSGEKSSSTDWPTAGLTLTNKAINTAGAGTIFIDADDATSGPAATLADVRGVLVYNDTVAGDYGICFNAFGGAQQVTNGTFAVLWNVLGIARISVA